MDTTDAANVNGDVGVGTGVGRAEGRGLGTTEGAAEGITVVGKGVGAPAV